MIKKQLPYKTKTINTITENKRIYDIKNNTKAKDTLRIQTVKKEKRENLLKRWGGNTLASPNGGINPEKRKK